MMAKHRAASGVFVTKDTIYVSDTDANRIVTFDLEGNFIKIIEAPESNLFGDNKLYKPVAIAVDQYNRLFIVSSGTYQGIIVMTDDGQFQKFIGAQATEISAWEKIWRKLRTEEQQSQQMENVSSEFNNIALSSDGFIYVTTSTIAEGTGQSQILGKVTDGTYMPVKKLNTSGDEIMARNGFWPPAGEVDFNNASKAPGAEDNGVSKIVDVACGPEQTWTIVDAKRSKLYTYDYDGNLLFAFGDMGRQLGNITQAGLAGIVYQDDRMLLLNKTDATFTVYNRTEYGDILIQALHNQNNRQNDKAIDDWTEILKRNSNFDAAYIGIGNALYRSGKYEESLDYFRSAYDTENYSNSYKEIRKEWLSKFILLVPVFVIAVCIACSKFLGYAKKVNKRVSLTVGKRTYGQELIYVFHLIFHPFDGYWDLKHEKRGSVRAAITFLGITILAFYYQAVGQGYILNPTAQYASVFSVVLSVCVPLALWIISNWCLTTLFDGEGSLKDIFIATCYALVPLAIVMIPATIASNFVLTTEANILSVVIAIGYIWAGMLIFFGTMVTHDYGLGKNFITVLGTILGMIVIMFISILFTTLLGKLVGFVTNIVTEIQYRV